MKTLRDEVEGYVRDALEDEENSAIKEPIMALFEWAEEIDDFLGRGSTKLSRARREMKRRG